MAGCGAKGPEDDSAPGGAWSSNILATLGLPRCYAASNGIYWGQLRWDVEDYWHHCDSYTVCTGSTDRSHAQLQHFPAGCLRGIQSVRPGGGVQSGCVGVVSGFLKLSTLTRAETLSPVCLQPCLEKLRSHKTQRATRGLVERFNCMLTIMTAKYQRDWHAHIPLVLMAYWSTAQDSTS